MRGDMGYLQAQQGRNGVPGRTVSLRVGAPVLARVRALVRASPCTDLDAAVVEAIVQRIVTHPLSHTCVVPRGQTAESREPSTVLTVWIPSAAEVAMREVIARHGGSLRHWLSAALATWCSSHPLAQQTCAIPRDLRRGGRRRKSRRVPRDFFVIVDAEPVVDANSELPTDR